MEPIAEDLEEEGPSVVSLSNSEEIEDSDQEKSEMQNRASGEEDDSLENFYESDWSAADALVHPDSDLEENNGALIR